MTFDLRPQANEGHSPAPRRTRIEDRIDALARFWPTTGTVFLTPAYLRALERLPDLRCYYAVLERSGESVACLTAQRFSFEASSFRRLHAGGPHGPAALPFLTCGNAFIAGPAGLWAAPTVSDAELAAWTHETLTEIALKFCADDSPVVGVKDLARGTNLGQELASRGYFAFSDDSTMVLDLERSWSHIDDYVAELRSPYRREYNRAKEKLAPIVRRPLAARDVRRFAERIDDLYSNVLERADLCPVAMTADVFATLADDLSRHFSIVGYFRHDRLVAFNTRYRDGADLESHYFGMDYEIAAQHALYRNLLYDDLADAISQGCHRLVLGRGAFESKSALGARPVGLSSFGWHPSPSVLAFVGAASALARPGPWIERRPLRTSTTARYRARIKGGAPSVDLARP